MTNPETRNETWPHENPDLVANARHTFDILFRRVNKEGDRKLIAAGEKIKKLYRTLPPGEWRPLVARFRRAVEEEEPYEEENE